ncbi:MAG: hypothetical protein ACI8U0_002749, partial [Flavobacteriales bacterium]
ESGKLNKKLNQPISLSQFLQRDAKTPPAKLVG